MKISVCMITYNGEKYVKEQMASILKQLKEDDEVIVSDDGSTDATLSVIESFGDPRIHIYPNTLENGYSKNVENALNHSTGDVIFLSDQDDVWKENKVAVMLAALAKGKIAIHNAEVTDENLKTTIPDFFVHYHVKPGFWRNFLRTRYTGACMAMKREFLQRALPFPDNQVLCPYDYWLSYLGEYYHEAVIVPDTLILYRRHVGTALTAGEYSTRSVKTRIATRFYCLRELRKRK